MADPTTPARIPRVRLFTIPPSPGGYRKHGATVGPGFAVSVGVEARTSTRAVSSRFRPSVASTWLTAGFAAVLVAAGCRQLAMPLESPQGQASQAAPTITGTIRGPERTTDVDGRIVEVINVNTNQRRRVLTDRAGGFSVTLDPGDYRVELTLREGEALVRQPGVIHVDRSGIDAGVDFVIGGGRPSRPRRPVYRVDDGLGSPVA